MINKSKAQAAVEFVILVGVVLFFFTLFFIAIQESSSEKIQEKQNLRVKEIALIVQNEIDLALQSRDGYSRTFEIPQKIGSVDYEISIEEDMVYVRTLNGKSAIALPVAKINGQINKPDNVIRKENGEIYLNT